MGLFDFIGDWKRKLDESQYAKDVAAQGGLGIGARSNGVSSGRPQDRGFLGGGGGGSFGTPVANSRPAAPANPNLRDNWDIASSYPAAPIMPRQETTSQTDSLLQQLIDRMNNPDAYATKYESFLNTQPITDAYGQSQNVLSEALASSLGSLNKIRDRAEDRYGEAEANVGALYNTHAEDIQKNNPRMIQKTIDEETGAYDKLNRDLVARLTQQGNAEEAERRQRAANIGAPNSAPTGHNALREVMGDITADTADRQSDAIADGADRKRFVTNQADAVRNEGSGAVASLVSELANVLSGYDSSESDLRTAYAGQNAALTNDYSGKLLEAQQAKSNAQYQATLQGNQQKQQGDYALLQQILGSKFDDQAAYNDRLLAQQQMQAEREKALAEASRPGSSKMQEIGLEALLRNMSLEEQKKLLESRGIF